MTSGSGEQVASCHESIEVLQTPDDCARALRRACKSRFFKPVYVDAALAVIEAAKHAGFSAEDFINLVYASYLL